MILLLMMQFLGLIIEQLIIWFKMDSTSSLTGLMRGHGTRLAELWVVR